MLVYSYLVISYLLLFAFVEVFKRKLEPHTEITRKLIHIGAGGLSIYWSDIISKNEFLILTSIFLGLFLFANKIKIFKSLYKLERKTYGDITFILGLLLLAVFFFDNRGIFTLGVLLLMWPDALAGLSNYYFKNSHTDVIHVNIYFVVALLITIFSLPFYQAIIISLVVTLTEYFSPYGTDNITVPAVYIASIMLLLQS